MIPSCQQAAMSFPPLHAPLGLIKQAVKDCATVTHNATDILKKTNEEWLYTPEEAEQPVIYFPKDARHDGQSALVTEREGRPKNVLP